MDRSLGCATLRLRSLAAALLLASTLSISSLPAAPPVQASPVQVTVNSDADEPLSPGALWSDCKSAPSDKCTLRAAIQLANKLGSDVNITLPAGTYRLTIPGPNETAGSTGDLNFNKAAGAVTLSGAGARTTIVDANAVDRVMRVSSGTTATVERVTVRGGHGATVGGGILNEGSLTLNESTVTGNTGHDGGGIGNNGSLWVTASTLTGNSAYYGGGLYFQPLTSSGGTTRLTNVTVSGNQAEYGGGVYAHPANGGIHLTNVTLANNQASHGGSNLGVVLGTASLTNTVIANGIGMANCSVTQGTILSAGGNVSSDASCPSLTGPNDRPNTDARLGPLLNNGGQTDTHALTVGSWAIDNGVNCPPPATDQRGVTRPYGPRCDSGAFEGILRAPCATRPNVGVGVSRGAAGTLVATISAHTDTYTPVNALTLLSFTRLAGATVEIAGQVHPAPFQYGFLNGAPSASFIVRRTAGSSSATVELTVMDACGPWNTFVGGGPSAFGSGSGPSASPTSIPTPTPTSAACTPRPKLTVATAPMGNGRLQVTIAVPPNTSDRLLALRFGAATNAVVEARGQHGPGSFSVSLPADTRQVQFVVSRASPGGAVTVPLTVVDECGEWPTVVGGGPAAF